MRLFEINNSISLDFGLLLFEGPREDYVEKVFGAKLLAAAKGRNNVDNVADLIELLSAADPTSNKQYLQFIVNMYLTKQFETANTENLKKLLTLFNKPAIKSRLEKKDIMQYKKIEELNAALEPFFDSDIKTKREEKKEIKGKVKKLIDTPDFKVYIPETEESACYIGANTKWCTAATKSENKFDEYNKTGPLYIIIAGNKKFQLHYEQGEFKNEENQDITASEIEYLSKYPKYKDFLNMMIKKHYLS